MRRVQKKELLSFIRSHEFVTFLEIEAFFRRKRYGYQGDTAIRRNGVLVWCGWSHKAARALQELSQEGRVRIIPDERGPAIPGWKGYGVPGFEQQRVILKRGDGFGDDQ